MTNDTIRDYWTGSALHAEYWKNQGSKRPAHEVRYLQRRLQQEYAKPLYRRQRLSNTEIN